MRCDFRKSTCAKKIDFGLLILRSQRKAKRSRGELMVNTLRFA